jgi:hypothetical protein
MAASPTGVVANSIGQAESQRSGWHREPPGQACISRAGVLPCGAERRERKNEQGQGGGQSPRGHIPPPVSPGVAGGIPEGRYDRNRGDNRSRCRQHGRPSAGAPWTPHQQPGTGQRQAHRGIGCWPPGHNVRRAEIGLYEQLIDTETAAQGVFGQDHRAEDRVEHARCQRRSRPSPDQRDERDPGQKTASAVLNDIGFRCRSAKRPWPAQTRLPSPSGPRRRTAGRRPG